MDILKSLMSDKSAGLMVSGLMGRGFTLGQAKNFLPEAGAYIVSTLKENGGNTDSASVISDIDVSSLALKMGIDESKVKNGLKYLLPSIVEQSSGSDILSKIKSFI